MRCPLGLWSSICNRAPHSAFLRRQGKCVRRRMPGMQISALIGCNHRCRLPLRAGKPNGYKAGARPLASDGMG
jgi:hypothetical protein